LGSPYQLTSKLEINIRRRWNAKLPECRAFFRQPPLYELALMRHQICREYLLVFCNVGPVNEFSHVHLY